MVRLASRPQAESATSGLSVPAGEFLYREGDAPGEMFLIEAGVVELIRQVGDDNAILAILDAGEFFGEAALLEGLPRDSSARARTPCKLLRLDGPELREALKGDPEIALRMLRRLSRRLGAALTARVEAETSARAVTSVASSIKPKGLPKAPAAAAAPAARSWRPRFVHENGDEFPLPASGEAVVGRADPVKGYTPDVVLSSLDAQRSLSRRHAKIVRRGDEFFVMEEPGVRNGTFVNGKALKAGQPQRIADGDEVSFGLIKTTFRLE
ncbi:MAG TPA: cyclic nucleotide-binding domain-containing protein [Vicinamibacteria bacterium]|nr:cyclic nucleotide-binding domain-containing protein [Vicinamibacteria bacterium]